MQAARELEQTADPGAGAGAGTAAGTAFLRVPSGKIGHLMDLVGELSLSVFEAVHSPDLAGRELPHFEAATHRLSMIVREVQDAAVELRMVSVDEVFKRLRRMVRELERQTGKAIDLVVEGAETAIDKSVADRLYDPLLHVLRNSADHGLEPPAERLAAGKPEAGRILLSASQIGSEVRIVVEDDGRGLNRDRILARARSRGLFGPEEEPEPATLWRVIFEPGFSTAEDVTNLSGRGVGMDVLNTTMTALRGRITVDSSAGQGTRVGLHIPVSLAFLDCLILRLGQRLHAAPIDSVAEILQADPSVMLEVSADGRSESVRLRGTFVPVLRLETFYGEPRQPRAAAQVLIVFHTSTGRIAVPVDEVIDRQQVVMKPLIGTLARVRASWGAALLGTGEVALVLNCEALASGAAR